MATQPISVTLPVTQAIDSVKRLLFHPFDLGKWFTIGFCAWLALLGEGGSGHFHMPGGGGNSHTGGGAGQSFREGFDQAREYVMEHLYWIVPVTVAVVVLIVSLWVLFTWLSSRGRFMFLHCVALNEAEVAVPWNRFVREGNSLFWFRIVLGLVGMALIVPPLGLGVTAGVRMALHDTWGVQGILGLVGLGCWVGMIGILLGLVGKFMTDFVVPIMFVSGHRCLPAWSQFCRLLGDNLGHFILYLLFQIVIEMVTGVLIVTTMIATCCIACCLLSLPFLGTVLLLPVLVFRRAYSLHYLSQYGREYDVFPSPAMPGA